VKAELFPPKSVLWVSVWGYALANSVFGGTGAAAATTKHPNRITSPCSLSYVTVVNRREPAGVYLRAENKGETVLDREQGSAGLCLLPLAE